MLARITSAAGDRFAAVFQGFLGLSKTLSAFRKIMGIVAGGSKALFTTSIVFNLLLSQLPAVLALTSKQIIDLLVSAGAGSGTSAKLAYVFGCAYLGILLLQHVGQLLLLFINETLTETASKTIHEAIIRAGIRLEGLSYFDDPDFYDRKAILENTALYIPMNFFRFTTEMASIVVTTLGMVAVLYALHPLVPLCILLAGLPDVLAQKRAHRLMFEGIRESAHEERLKEYYRSVLLTEEYAKEVRIYDLRERFIDKYKECARRILNIVLPIRRKHIRHSAWTRTLVSIGTIIPFLWIVARAVHGDITPGRLVLFMTAIVVIQQQLARAAQTLAGHQDVVTVVKELAAWLEMKSDIEIVPQPARPARKEHSPAHVRIDNVWFKYPGSANFVLKGLDLELKRGKSLAIVGRNGCGKSTLVKLICRLYDPQEGSIHYDQTDLRHIPLETLRTATGVIFQDFMRYHLTVKENIALQDADEDLLAHAAFKAAATAGAEDFIRHLPQRYETLLGRQFPGGTELSGGQWQKLALARAFFRNAELLILDEPTASLDIATEAAIYAHFKTMTEGKTALLISHRLSTVRIADCIAVMDGGKVVELGDHASLMGQGGIYGEMFTLQAERYRAREASPQHNVDAF